MDKEFKLPADQIQRLVPRMGGCFATDMITVASKRVGYMYREKPDSREDSGWRFVSGEETQEYVDDAANTMIYEVNTIANYDVDLIPFLDPLCGRPHKGSSVAHSVMWPSSLLQRYFSVSPLSAPHNLGVTLWEGCFAFLSSLEVRLCSINSLSVPVQWRVIAEARCWKNALPS